MSEWKSMNPYYEQNGITIYHGDCREILPMLSGSVTADVCIVDPVWPNSVASLHGADRPSQLFAEMAVLMPQLTARMIVHLGCDSDPRFLESVPPSMKFIRACCLEYALARPKGRILYTGDMAYVFGIPPKSRPCRRLMPGLIISTKADYKRPRTIPSSRRSFEGKWMFHPCPRRLEHVAWLVKWFADGLVIDPFAGVGTTLLAAKLSGYPAIGIEIDESYCEKAARRLDQGVFDFEDRKITANA